MVASSWNFWGTSLVSVTVQTRRHAHSPIFISSSLYGAQKVVGGARSAGIRLSKATLRSAAGKFQISWSAFWVWARFESSIDASSMRKCVVCRKYECGKRDRVCLSRVTWLDCSGEVEIQRTFYGSGRGSRAVQGFKLRFTILYIIYRMVTSLA